MQTMVELTVMFKNLTIEPLVLTTGPFEATDEKTAGDDFAAEVFGALDDLRRQAERMLGDTLLDEQCFYRFFRR